MQRIIAFLVLLLPAVLGAKYDGMFKLAKATDENNGNVPIPGDFDIKIWSETETVYNVSLKIGNSLRCQMTVTPGDDGKDTAVIGDIMSTMMMPPENIFRLEQFLSTHLPKTNFITLEGDTLTLIGEGTVELKKQ